MSPKQSNQRFKSDAPDAPRSFCKVTAARALTLALFINNRTPLSRYQAAKIFSATAVQFRRVFSVPWCKHTGFVRPESLRSIIRAYLTIVKICRACSISFGVIIRFNNDVSSWHSDFPQPTVHAIQNWFQYSVLLGRKRLFENFDVSLLMVYVHRVSHFI